MRSGGGRLHVGLLGTYFLSAHEIKLGVRGGFIGRTMVVIEGGETYVAVLGQ